MSKNIINGTVSIGDTDMYYVSFGTGSKKLVVLPGLSDGLATVKGKGRIFYHPYKKHLKDYTVYMFSRKNVMPYGYSIGDMADDQVTVMKKLGVEKAYICGVSQGGMIAQSIAIDHPEVVEKLILAVTTPYAGDVAKNAVSGWIDMADRNDHVKLMVDTAEKMYSDEYLSKNRKLFPILIWCQCLPVSFLRVQEYMRDRRLGKGDSVMVTLAGQILLSPKKWQMLPSASP